MEDCQKTKIETSANEKNGRKEGRTELGRMSSEIGNVRRTTDGRGRRKGK